MCRLEASTRLGRPKAFISSMDAFQEAKWFDLFDCLIFLASMGFRDPFPPNP